VKPNGNFQGKGYDTHTGSPNWQQQTVDFPRESSCAPQNNHVLERLIVK